MKLPDESPTGILEVLSRFVEELLASANGLIEVQVDRVRLSVRRRIVTAAIAGAAALCAALWLGAAVLATLRGLCGWFTALSGGREWLGELCGGVFALLLAAGAVALGLKLYERREIHRLEAKYERIRNASRSASEREKPPEDGGAAARSGAGAGDPARP